MLECPLDCKEIKSVSPKGNQPWMFIGRTDAEAEAEAPVLWPPMGRANLLNKTLMLGKIEGKRRKGWQRMRWLYTVTDSMDMSLSKLRKLVKDREAWHAGVHGVARSCTWLSNRTTTMHNIHFTIWTFLSVWFIPVWGFPGGASGKESTFQCRRLRRPGFDPWVKEDPWRRKWQPTPVFLPGKFHGQRSWWATVHGVAESDTTEHIHIMPPPPSTFIPDQTLSLCRDYFWNLILRFHRSALEVPAWEPGCLCFAALSWQDTGKQQVAMHLVCSWTGYHVITSSSPCHLQCGSLLSPSSKLRFTSLKEELGHCWTMLISAKARCIFSWGLWRSAPKWSLFNKGISSNWILKMELWIHLKGSKRSSGLKGRGEAVFWASMMHTLKNSFQNGIVVVRCCGFLHVFCEDCVPSQMQV